MLKNRRRLLPVSPGRRAAVFLSLLVSVTSTVHSTYLPSSSTRWPLSWWPSPDSRDRTLGVRLCVVPAQNFLPWHQMSTSRAYWRTHSSSNSPTPAQTVALNRTRCQCHHAFICVWTYWLMYEPNDSLFVTNI